MIVESQAVGPFFKNGFVVGCEETREAVLIDPGDEVASLLAFVEHGSAVIEQCADVVTRHGVRAAIKFQFRNLDTFVHVDHVTGVAAAKRALNVPIHLHKDDLFLYDRAVEMGAMFGLTVEPQPPIDRFYAPTQTIPFGTYEARVHHTPGHCPGGVCLQIGKANTNGNELFVGDTLFAGSIGRTDLPGGDYDTLIASIRNVLFPLGDEAIVHSGHGPDTTIGKERLTNPFLVHG